MNISNIFQRSQKIIHEILSDNELRAKISNLSEIGPILDLVITISEKTKEKQQQERTKEELAFFHLIKITFESTIKSLEYVGLNNFQLDEDYEKTELLKMLDTYKDKTCVYLPHHPSIARFRKNIIHKLRKITNEPTITKFIIHFNLHLEENISQDKNFGEYYLSWFDKENKIQELIRYLEYVKSLNRISHDSNKPLEEYYVEPVLLEVNKQSWDDPFIKTKEEYQRHSNLFQNISKTTRYSITNPKKNNTNKLKKNTDEELLRLVEQHEAKLKLEEKLDPENFSTYSWNDFLMSNDRLILVGAHYGTGKTSAMRNLASKLAVSYLNSSNQFQDYIQIMVFLRYELNDVYRHHTLDEILTKIITINQENNERKILLILDGLDEYSKNHEELIAKIKSFLVLYVNMKVIITSRLNININNLFFDRYIRILPFYPKQVTRFFRRYGIPKITYQTLKQSELTEEEIRTPIFCWMLALMYKEKSFEQHQKIKFNTNVRRTLFYSEFIYGLLRGKYRKEAESYGWSKYYKDEKILLRLISSISYSLKNKCNISEIKKYLFNTENYKKYIRLEESLEPIINSYFYIDDSNYEKRVEFLHRTIQEYLFAEYIIQNILHDKWFKINMPVLAYESPKFLIGIMDFIITSKNDSKHYQEQLLLNFDYLENNEIKQFKNFDEFKKILLDKSKNSFLNDRLVVERKTIVNLEDKSTMELDSTDIEKGWMYKWILLIIIKKLDPGFKISKNKLKNLVEHSRYIPDELKIFINIEMSSSQFFYVALSKSRFIGCDLRHFTGSNSPFSKSLFYRCNGTDIRFQYCDLQFSQIAHCDFTKINIRGSDLSFSTFTQTLFKEGYMPKNNFESATFVNCDLSFADLSNCVLVKARLENVDLSHSRFINVNVDKIDVKGIIHTKGIRRVDEDYENNPEKIKGALLSIDVSLRNIILKDNPNYKQYLS